MKTIINELQTRHKEFFESQLATHLLKHPEYFPSVGKISEKITRLMERHKNKVIDIIKQTPKITEELQEPYFGASLGSEQPITAQTVYENILAVLSGQHRDLSNVIQVHCIFIHRIYDHLEQPAHKADLVNTLFPLSLFNNEYRGRKEKPSKPSTTHAQGITQNSFFSKKIEAHEKAHLRALDKFEPNQDSNFTKSAMEHNLPIVCGPSGHTGSLMLGAKLYGELTADELKEYALASFSFLTSGGNHSFHEVYLIANLLGVTYEMNNYAASIPETIAEAETMQPLKSNFPMYLK